MASRVPDGRANRGAIAQELGELDGPKALYLSNSDFGEIIPSEIGNLPELTTLDLSFNRLRREIPEELSMLTDLASLNVGCNNLPGNPTLVLASFLLRSRVLSRNELQVDISGWHDLYPRLTHLALVNNLRGKPSPMS